MTDPASFFTSNAWVPVAIGVLLSLVVHVGKTMARPAANAMTAGLAAPVLSGIEDVVSVVLTFLAIVLPDPGDRGHHRRRRRRRRADPPRAPTQAREACGAPAVPPAPA